MVSFVACAQGVPGGDVASTEEMAANFKRKMGAYLFARVARTGALVTRRERITVVRVGVEEDEVRGLGLIVKVESKNTLMRSGRPTPCLCPI
jgi:hypothetical protein